MKKRSAFQVMGLSLGLFMMPTAQATDTRLQIVTLRSPNEESFGNFGTGVAGAGDVNQDGFADVIVGAQLEDPGSSPADAGRAYIFSGPDGSLLFELVSPNEEEGGDFGRSVSGAGDVNQDGFADVIVGAEGESPGSSPADAGRAYIFSGRDGSLLLELISPNEDDTGSLGRSVSGVGDVNHDGFADVIVGAPLENPGSSPTNAGRAYVFSGQDGSVLFELVSPNEEVDAGFGDSVSGAGDVNHDGFADVIVGAPFENPGSSPIDAGRAYVFSGQDGSVLFQLASPNEELFGLFGLSVSGVGNVNQEGPTDVIVGAPTESPGTSPNGAGRAYIFSGQAGSLLFELMSPNEQQSGSFGWSLSGAGDVNQDGLVDVIVGATGESTGTSPRAAGRAYLLSGQDGSLLFELASPNEKEFGDFGFSVSGAGDVNQDGSADVIVGALFEGPGRPAGTGSAYIFVSRRRPKQ